MAPARSSGDEPRHPIQIVARRAGLTADVIRAWERRYRVVTPQRTPTGRRLYTDADARRLRLLKTLVDNGRRIGDVARLDSAALAALAESDRREGGAFAAAARGGGESVAARVEACARAVAGFDAAALERALASAGAALAIPVLLDEFLAALMRRVGQGWRDGPLRVAHEHFASAAVRSFLGGLLGDGRTAPGPTLVVATPCRQMHAVGALGAAVCARHAGWRVVYLGGDVPCDEVAYAAAASEARAVGLGLCYPGDDPHLPGELRRLRRRLPPRTAILAGGGVCPGYAAALADVGALVVHDARALQACLDRLRAPCATVVPAPRPSPAARGDEVVEAS